MDAYNMIDDFIKEDSRQKSFDSKSTEKRKKRLEEIIKNHKTMKQKNDEIMEDFRMIYNPRAFPEYKKNNFRRWVGKQGKYLNPKIL